MSGPALQVFPLDSRDGRRLLAQFAGGPDVTVDAESNGFDCRRYDWAIDLPPGFLLAQYSAGPQSANRGEVMLAAGPRSAVAGVLRRAGYDVRMPAPAPGAAAEPPGSTRPARSGLTRPARPGRVAFRARD